MSGHPVPSSRLYVMVFVALAILTGLTVAVSYLDLGRMNAVVALLIAFIKAGLVATFFMQLKGSPALSKLASAVGLVWMGILLWGTFADYLTRAWSEAARAW